MPTRLITTLPVSIRTIIPPPKFLSFVTFQLFFSADSFDSRSELVGQFKGQFFTISSEKGLPSQNFRCFDCQAPIGIIYGPPRVCAFTGCYYCVKCHDNTVSRVNPFTLQAFWIVFLNNKSILVIFKHFLDVCDPVADNFQLGLFGSAGIPESEAVPVPGSTRSDHRTHGN